MRILTWFTIITLGLLACSSPNTQIDPASINPDEAAIPDGIAYPEVELSEEDKQKLAAAKGVSAKSISKEDLEAWLNEQESPALLCYFWTLDDKHAKIAMDNLQKLSSNIAADKLNVVLVNTDTTEKEQQANALVREAGVAGHVFRLEDSGPFKGIMGNPTKGSGVFFIYNNTDETGVFYKQELSFEELYVLLQTFTI